MQHDLAEHETSAARKRGHGIGNAVERGPVLDGVTFEIDDGFDVFEKRILGHATERFKGCAERSGIKHAMQHPKRMRAFGWAAVACGLIGAAIRYWLV